MKERKTEVVSFYNQKGGVGKTTTIVNLCQILGEKYKKKVLLIDNDPQNSASFLLNVNIRNTGKAEDFKNGMSTLGYLMQKFQITGKQVEYNDLKDTIIRPTYRKSVKIENSMKWKEEVKEYQFDLLPGVNHDLSLAELIHVAPSPDIFINKPENKQYARIVLKLIVDKIIKYFDYDYIFIDCPPSLGILSTNALISSTSLIIPNTTDMLSSIGIQTIIDTLRDLKKYVPNFKIKGILFNEYKNTKFDNELIEDVISYAESEGINVFKTKIPLYLPLKKISSDEELAVQKKDASIQKYNDAIDSLAKEIIETVDSDLKTISAEGVEE